MKRKSRIGSSFDDFLKDEGLYEEVAAKAIKRVIARQLGAVMRENHLTKSMLARRMRTSRSQLERVLDWSGVPVVHLRPTFFAEWLLIPRSRATIVEDGIIDLPYGEGRHAPIAGEDQARLIAAILAQPAAHLGKTYPLHGPIELDQAGIAAAVSEVLGRKISYRPLTIPGIGSVQRSPACRSF